METAKKMLPQGVTGPIIELLEIIILEKYFTPTCRFSYRSAFYINEPYGKWVIGRAREEKRSISKDIISCS